MSVEGIKNDTAVLVNLIKKNSFKQILTSLGFFIVSEEPNYALLKDKKGVQLIVARFDSLDNPVRVYFWPLNELLSKASALLYILDNHHDESIRNELALLLPSVDDVKGRITNDEFIFSEPLSLKKAKDLCMCIKSVKEVPYANDIDLTVLSADPYSFRVYDRKVLSEGNSKDYMSFLLFKNESKEPVGVQSIEFNGDGKVKEVASEGFFNGYFTNDKPKGASKGILFFSFETFLEGGGYKDYIGEKVFVFPKGSKSDLFLEVFFYCKKEGLELYLYSAPGQYLEGVDNYIRFNLFYLCLKNPSVRAMDFSGDLLSRKVTFSFDKQKYEMLHFAECYKELRMKSIRYYEGMMLSMDDFIGLVPVADNNLIEKDYWCQLNFCLKEPLLGFALEYLFKALKIDPPKMILEK